MEEEQWKEEQRGSAEQAAKGRLFPLIAAILGLGVVLISVICACLGGVKAEGVKIGTFEFFNFGSQSTWHMLITMLKEKVGSAVYYSTFIQYVLGLLIVVAMLVTLLVMVILAAVRFFRGWKTGDFGKACKSAYGAYAAFLGGQVAILSLFSGTGLNPAATVGAVLAGLMVGAMVALQLVTEGKQTFSGKKSLTHFILVLCEMVFAILTLAFAGRPLVEKTGTTSFIDYLLAAGAAASLTPNGAMENEAMLSGTFGALVTVLLALACVLLIVKCCNELSHPSTEVKRFRKATWQADTVAACVLGVIAIDAIWIGAAFGSVAQVMLIVSAVAVYGVAIGDYFVLKKM